MLLSGCGGTLAWIAARTQPGGCSQCCVEPEVLRPAGCGSQDQNGIEVPGSGPRSPRTAGAAPGRALDPALLLLLRPQGAWNSGHDPSSVAGSRGSAGNRARENGGGISSCGCWNWLWPRERHAYPGSPKSPPLLVLPSRRYRPQPSAESSAGLPFPVSPDPRGSRLSHPCGRNRLEHRGGEELLGQGRFHSGCLSNTCQITGYIGDLLGLRGMPKSDSGVNRTFPPGEYC
ncbi:uncharacterized protein LOC116993333 [Catharus ustulatus]|uniref:uncharacterized protein LOC116993333 n=1 Tax=Catharus ustulatus TaxID=91951 RepID=UPI00140AD3B4|nr:uncharacterized protein LOC116993333 [Catharus ustulatus]